MPQRPSSTHQCVARKVPSCSLAAVGNPNLNAFISSTPDPVRRSRRASASYIRPSYSTRYVSSVNVTSSMTMPWSP